MSAPQLLLATVLMEPNRHKPGKHPSFRVSEFLPRIAACGFSGIELWENHAARATPEELDALRHGTLPITIYNCYTDFAAEDTTAVRQLAEMAVALGARGIKWNFGNDPAASERAIANARLLAELLPADVRLLCECHGGTIAEVPAGAARLLAQIGDASRIQAIVHSAAGPAMLAQWFEALGERITHVHAVLAGRLSREEPLAGVHYLHERGFTGSIALEFTDGMGTADDTPAANLDRAARDLQTLKSIFRITQ